MDKIDLLAIEDLNVDEIRQLLGPHNSNLKILEDLLDISLTYRDNAIIYEGSKQAGQMLWKILEITVPMLKQNKYFGEQDIIYVYNLIQDEKEKLVEEIDRTPVVRTYDGKNIVAKTYGQHQLISAMRNNDIVFSIGPAGTGKTFLAVAYAAHLLKQEAIRKIVLTRPAVEAGESLGFLPGDLKEKVDPYLQPLYDALDDVFGNEAVVKYMEKGIIEIAPLAYMRGRTLNNSFVILDEAQNATRGQIKMFLTRLGFQSKMLINGDITQVDLRDQATSGLKSSYEILKDIREIAFVYLTSRDVVRHPLVQKIIEAYEKK